MYVLLGIYCVSEVCPVQRAIAMQYFTLARQFRDNLITSVNWFTRRHASGVAAV